MTLPPAFSAFLLLAGGLTVLLIGAKYFVDGIAAIAEALGVPPIVIGMTLVAFGTSTPELVINALSASRGETALAFGNIVGSCTVNIGMVLAITALIHPLKVEPSLITREIPMLWVGVAALLILGNDRRLGGAAADSYGRADGLILLLLFAIFLYYTVIYSLARKRLLGSTAAVARDPFLAEVAQEQERQAAAKSEAPLARQGLITALGLAAVSIGAGWTVDGATAAARLIGLSEHLIGLTILSIGTTLPELVTCVVAARRGNADIALGNVVGSNLFNILAIGGLVPVIAPVAVPPGGQVDLAFIAVLSVVLLPLAIRSGQTITRGEGAFLLACYLGFMLWRVALSG